MTREFPPRTMAFAATAAALFILAGVAPSALWAKDKTAPPDPNDPTSRVFQMLDDSHGGKLNGFYILGDTFVAKDANNQDAEFQHVFLVEYDKAHAFGKLTIHVRSLAKLAPEQLKTYTLKQIYDFGADDTEKFSKSEAGQLGRTGDLYVAAVGDRPLASAPITEEARKHYDFFLTQYVIPALKNGDPGTASAALGKQPQ